MRRLSVRLSLAFGMVVLISSAIILALSIVVARANRPAFMPLAPANPGGLRDRLQDYFAIHRSWAGVEAVFSGAESAAPPGAVSFALTDAAGAAIYGQPAAAGAAPPMPLLVEGAVVGTLQVTFQPDKLPPDEASFVLQELSRLFAMIALVGGAIGVCGGILMSRSLTAPLSRLAAAAQAIGARKLSQRVEPSGSAEVVAVASAFNDMAAALQQSEQLRRNLVADVAHELRTPLSVLQGNLRAILDRVYPLDEVEVARLYDQTRVLSRLVSDLHELTQAEARQLPLNFQPTDLAATVGNVAASFAPVAEAAEVGLEVSLAADLPRIQADGLRLTQVLHNLLLNALRHTPAGGAITVGLRREAASLLLTVADSGEGIAPEHLPHIFDRFYRADPARARSSGGAGLGLAIVRALVEAHGGTIAAASDGRVGTTFTITLPLA